LDKEERPVHEAAFDRLAVAVLRRASRRGVLAALAAVAAGRYALAGPASAKKKKKRCQFVKTPTVWTLRKSCTTTRTIAIPGGVMLDGAGRTIRAKGPAAKFGDGLIESAGATAGVKNLTLDARGVTGGCVETGPQHGIFFGQADGTVENTSVRGVCGWAIETGSAGIGKTLDVTGCSIDATGAIRGGVVVRKGSITNTTVANGATGFSLTNGAVTIDSCTVTGAVTGLSASATANVTVTSSDFTVGRFGLVFDQNATGDVSGNSIVGPGSFGGDTAGIVYRGGSGGDASGNEISGFDDSVGSNGCGILVAADAGTVTLDTGGANTFPNPPGNEQDVCDLQP
jgi:hypothetical protein